MFQGLLSLIPKLPLYTSPFWMKICFLVGLISIISWSLRVLFTVWQIFLRSEHELLKRYGENSYAVITGASDGIGKAYCFALAKRGFNIIMISRTKSKLDQVAQEVRAQYPGVEVKVIVADFKYSMKETFFSDIVNMLKDLDISILVNNVGIGFSRFLPKMTEEEIKDTIMINCIPQAILSKHIIPIMNARQKRSAIISISSFASLNPSPILQVYGATKIYNDYLSKALRLENPKIDCMSVTPAYVATAMIASDPKKMKQAVSAEECVEGSLRDLGHDKQSFGSLKHHWLYLWTSKIPVVIREYILKKRNLKPRKEQESSSSESESKIKLERKSDKDHIKHKLQ